MSIQYPYTNPISFPLSHPHEIIKILRNEQNDATIVPDFQPGYWCVQARTQKSFWHIDWIRTRVQGIDEGITYAQNLRTSL